MRVVMLGQPAAVEVVCDCVRRCVYRWLQQQAPAAHLIGKAHPAPAPVGDDNYRAREIARLEAAVAEREPQIAEVEAQLAAAESRLAELAEPALAARESAAVADAARARCDAAIVTAEHNREVQCTRILEIARAQMALERATAAEDVAQLTLERDAWLDLASAESDAATYRVGVAESEVAATQRSIDDYQAQLRRLRLGRYAEAQRRLPELRARRA